VSEICCYVTDSQFLEKDKHLISCICVMNASLPRYFLRHSEYLQLSFISLSLHSRWVDLKHSNLSAKIREFQRRACSFISCLFFSLSLSISSELDLEMEGKLCAGGFNTADGSFQAYHVHLCLRRKLRYIHCNRFTPFLREYLFKRNY
jgi:hypothetical protein